MDMNCRKCNEPWDWFYIRDDILENQPLYEKMAKSGGYVKENLGNDYSPHEIPPISLLRKGHKRTREEMEALANWQFAPGPYILQCPACIGKDIEPNPNADIYAAMADILGDDIDGFMAEVEDMEYLFDL